MQVCALAQTIARENIDNNSAAKTRQPSAQRLKSLVFAHCACVCVLVRVVNLTRRARARKLQLKLLTCRDELRAQCVSRACDSNNTRLKRLACVHVQ